MSRSEPVAIQLAVAEAYGVAERLLEEEGRLPLFAVFHRGERDAPVVAVLRLPVNDEAAALEALREDASSIASGHQASAVTLGGGGLLARGAEEAEARAIWQGLRTGTLESLADVPGARPALLLEHHRPLSVTRAAFPLWSNGLGAQQLFLQTEPAAEAEPFAGIRFFAVPGA